MQPNKTSAGDLADPLELEGTELLPIAGEGQWQNGTTEIHGGIWRRIFVKMLQEVQPKNDLEWAECVDATNEAKSATYKRHGYSSYHHVFGRDRYVASDLLQGPIDVTAATQPLYDSGAERSTAIRMAARKAALELQDSGRSPARSCCTTTTSQKVRSGRQGGRTGVEARVKASNKVGRDGTAEQLWPVSKANTRLWRR